MSYKILEGKKGIVFGALDHNSIAWKASEAIVEAGGEIILTNAPVAIRMGAINDLADKISAPLIPADATSIQDLENLISEHLQK